MSPHDNEAMFDIKESICAFGTVQDFWEITLDIPQDWTVKFFQKFGGYAVKIEKDYQSSFTCITTIIRMGKMVKNKDNKKKFFSSKSHSFVGIDGFSS